MVAKIYPPLKRLVPGIIYHHVHPVGERGECQYGAQPWFEPRRQVGARRLIEPSDPVHSGTLPVPLMGHQPGSQSPGVQHFYDGRATIEVRIRELRQDFAFAHIPTRRLAANALDLEIIRLPYHLVTAFQRLCLPDDWQTFTLQKLRHKHFLLPGELVPPQNRPVLRLNSAPQIQPLAPPSQREFNALIPCAKLIQVFFTPDSGSTKLKTQLV